MKPQPHLTLLSYKSFLIQFHTFSVVANSKEWKYLKSLNDTSSAYEEQMFASSEDEVKIFVRGNELVHIPFKFQSFTTFGVTPEMVGEPIDNLNLHEN